MPTTLVLALILLPQLVDKTEEPEPPPRADVSIHQRAQIFMARKMYREAVETYLEILEAEPKSARVYNKLGVAYHHQGADFLQSAAQSYQKAIQLEPTFAEAINNLGTVYYARGKYKKATKFYRRALNLRPTSASMHSNLGTAYFARKQYKKAAHEYTAALEIDPHVFEVRNTVGTLLQERSVRDRARYSYFMARAYAQSGMLEQALLHLRRAVEEGYGNRKKILAEPLFEPLHEDPVFQRLVHAEQQSAELRP